MVHDYFAEERGALHAVATYHIILFFSPLDRSTLIYDHAVVYYVRCQYPNLSHDTQLASLQVPVQL